MEQNRSGEINTWVSHPVQFLAFYGICKFIAVFTIERNVCLSWARRIYPKFLGLESGLYASGFTAEIFQIFLSFPMCVCLTSLYHILIDDYKKL